MATTVKNSRRRRFVTFTTALLVVGVISVAGAAWLASGEGTGQADAGEAADLTIATSAVSAEDDVLYPNNYGSIRFIVKNTNPYNVDIDDVTFGTVIATDDDCDPHGVGFRDIVGPGDDLGLIVGANDTLNVELVDGAYMDNTSDSDCQNSSFTADVTINGTSTDAIADNNTDWHEHLAPAGW